MKLCLIIDESQSVRKVARALLNRLGFEVVEAATAQEALDICRQRRPDAVLLDWQLAGTEIQAFLPLLMRNVTGPKPFVVYTTTDLDPADLSRAFAAGADAYILKPIEKSDIEDKFAELLRAA